MKQVMKRLPRNVLPLLVAAVFSVFLVTTLSTCKKSDVGQEETPVDTRIQELESKVQDLETDVAEKNKQITQLEEGKTALERQIPRVHDVETGDNHWQIAYNFLIQQKNIPEADAKGILSRAFLFHPLRVGFRVWNYFHHGVFGTFITQGSAPVTQKYLVRMEEKKKREEKRMLEKKIVEMEGTEADLEEKINDMEKDKESLKTQISALDQEISACQRTNEDLTAKLNSLYYLTDTKDSLKEQGKIKGSFLGICGTRIAEISFGDFQHSVDLRTNDLIVLTADDFGVPRIKKVELLPKHLEKDRDFRVEISSDGQKAKVHVLNKDKFRLSRIIICIN